MCYGMEIREEGKRFWLGKFKYLQIRLQRLEKLRTGYVSWACCAIDLSSLFRRSVLWNASTQIGPLPVRCSRSYKGEEHEKVHTNRFSVYGFSPSLLAPLSGSVRLTSTITCRAERMIVLHCALRLLLRHLWKSVHEEISVEDWSLEMWKCFPALERYCCDIPKRKDTSTVLHQISLLQPWFCSLSKVEDIWHLQCQEVCDVAKTKAKRQENIKERKREAAVQTAYGNIDSHRVFWTVGSRCWEACGCLIGNPFGRLWNDPT